MRMLKSLCVVGVLSILCLGAGGGGCDDNSSDKQQQEQQEAILQEATNQVGMPAVKNFRERKLLKDIIELRDQQNLVTYTYVFSEVTGKYTYLGQTIGYGLPYSTQFTNPQKAEYRNRGGGAGIVTLPQADPNGLFSPQSAEGTWIMMYNATKKTVEPQYIESRISVFTYKLGANLVQAGY